ncbi:MAG: hypothetical protein JO105_12355 [Hyphomicrobiales bacterium]|nr:hypothetical protein [Hyphomicrobiales bacterium]
MTGRRRPLYGERGFQRAGAFPAIQQRLGLAASDINEVTHLQAQRGAAGAIGRLLALKRRLPDFIALVC